MKIKKSVVTLVWIFLFFSVAGHALDSTKGPKDLPEGTIEESVIEPLPDGKVPLIKKSYRPPNYETPLEAFSKDITSNNSFFVRYHLSGIPKVNVQEWNLTLSGESFEHPVTFSLKSLKNDFKQVELTALTYCSGNRRGLYKPHIPGVQWGYGAMGNARWRGVRLRDLIEKAGLKKEAVEVVFDGADIPAYDQTPDYQKSLPISKAMDENTIVALEMNGKPLPQNQGFPTRLVVPGWTATYWVKHLISVKAISKPFDGYWVHTAYRIPKNTFPGERFPSQDSDTTTPITEIVVNSLITNLHDDQHFKKDSIVDVQGLAWDGGHGIDKVEVSTDNGKSWQQTLLGKNYGNFSWRRFSFKWQMEKPGEQIIMARATNRLGFSQKEDLVSNAAGYHHNVIQKLKVHVDPNP